MRKINLHLTFSLNNIFIIITKETISTVLWSQSLGSIGFKNKSKQLTEAFKLLLSRTTEYLLSNNLKINQIHLNYLMKKRIKIIKKQLANWQINTIIINRGVSHNGCRIKKNSRKKHRNVKIQNIKL